MQWPTLSRICCGSNGFSMKSETPAFINCTASGTSAWPVMTMTGQLFPRRAFSRRTNSGPSTPGIRTSVTTQALASVGRSSRKSSALAKARARNPAPRSIRVRASRMAGSSSTMKTECGVMGFQTPWGVTVER